MSEKPIVILGGKKRSTNIVYNALKDDFDISKVVLEDGVPTSRFLKNRMKKLGLTTVIGQLLFQVLIAPFLRHSARGRTEEIMAEFGLDDSAIDPDKVVEVVSVNAEAVEKLLKGINPAVVVINGTRIIAKRILSCTRAKFVNMHAGITPLYRGVHGGYWALTENNREACGVTVHLVDLGIDTGCILEQTLIEPSPADNFTTYPLLQIGAGLPLLKKAISSLLDGQAEEKPAPEGPSRLWSHPTLWQYFGNRKRLGVK